MTETRSAAIDLQFSLQGRAVPHDYADALWHALQARLPWLDEEKLAGIHPLYGLSPGQGEWYLSRRSHLNLRLPRARIAAAEALCGACLDLSGSSVELGKATARELTPTPVLYAKFVTLGKVDDGADPPDEVVFFAACERELASLDLKPNSVLCGKRQTARTMEGVLHGFSLMVNGLKGEANLRLQEHGLGAERKHGCGIFVAHKSSAVGTLE
jgi:CRISPR-associated protein Cas6